MGIKMIAFDLDGTVFDDQKKILPKTKAALEKAAADGIEIVPATGRPLCGVSEQIWQLRGVRYLLTSNGAGIYRADTEECIYENNMKLEEFLPLLARLEPLEVMGDVFVRGKGFMSRKKRRLIDRLDTTGEMKDYIRNSRTCVDNLTEFLRQDGADIQKITINFVGRAGEVSDNRKKVQEILRDFPEFTAVSGGMNNIEVTDKSATKGSGILKLGELLGIRREEILAFGDSGNDATMLQMAGIGVAMENAEPPVKAIADFVTRSNTEEGIAYALGKFL